MRLLPSITLVVPARLQARLGGGGKGVQSGERVCYFWLAPLLSLLGVGNLTKG